MSAEPVGVDAASTSTVIDSSNAAVGDDAREPTVTYAVITPSGTLQIRTVDNRVIIEWDTPYQVSLWAAVHQDVDPRHGEVNGVALADGMRAKVADAAGYDPLSYPPNPVAQAVLTTLGHPSRRWAGTIAIVGNENEHGITASLTAEQLDILGKAHRLALAAARRPAPVRRLAQ